MLKEFLAGFSRSYVQTMICVEGFAKRVLFLRNEFKQWLARFCPWHRRQYFLFFWNTTEHESLSLAKQPFEVLSLWAWARGGAIINRPGLSNAFSTLSGCPPKALKAFPSLEHHSRTWSAMGRPVLSFFPELGPRGHPDSWGLKWHRSSRHKKSPSYLGLTNHSSVARNTPLFTGRLGIVIAPQWQQR